MLVDFVLLRGLARQSKHWGAFVPILQQAFPHARIHTPDLPGAGVLRREKTPTNIEAFIPSLQRQVSLSSDSIKVLIGMSLGGAAALSWSAQHPELFAHTFIINSSVANLSAPSLRLLPSARWSLLKALCTINSRRREEIILSLVSNNPKRQKEALDSWELWQKTEPMRIRNILCQLKAAASYSYEVRTRAGQRHILASMSDRLCSVRCSEALAHATKASLALHEHAGHDLTLDDPQWVVSQIAKHVVAKQ